MNRFIQISCRIGSCACVALGHSVFFPFLGPLAAAGGFALFWSTLARASSRRIGWISFIWFWVVELLRLSWMTDIRYQGLYILFVYIVLSAICALQFSLLSRIAFRKSHPFDGKTILGIAGVWVLLEWSRLYWFCGFAFDWTGLALTCYPSSTAFASTFGIFGLSFWVILTNLFGLRFVLQPKSFRNLSVWIALILVPYVFGSAHIAYRDICRARHSEKNLRVLLVQPGLLPSQKYRMPGEEKDFVPPLQQWEEVLKELSSYRFDSNIDLIVFPEAAFPYGADRYIYEKSTVCKMMTSFFGEAFEFPPEGPPFSKSFPEGKIGVSNAYWMQCIANRFGSEVIAGLDAESRGKSYNSAFSFEKGKTPDRYDKRVLLPFVEYLPFAFLRSITARYGIEEFAVPGANPVVFKKHRIAPCICYEEFFPSLLFEARAAGAKMFVSLNNDGWFPNSRLSLQHFAHGFLRSVENGVPSLHCSATGVTAVVDDIGTVIARLPTDKRGVLSASLSTYSHPTLFSFLGPTPFIVLSAVFSLFLISGIRKTLPKAIP